MVDVSQAPYLVTPDLSPEETTRRINRAIRDNIGTPRGKTIYLPDGTYRVNDTLAFMTWSTANPEYQFPYLTLLGQSRDKTVIRLVDNASGYSDLNAPKAVVSTLEITPGAKDVWTFVHFGIYIKNLTVDTGSGNAGAIGIEYMVNNLGALRDLTVRGQGHAGIDMRLRSQPGPGLVKNVKVDGFDYAIDVGTWAYCMTIEHLEISNQRVAGIRNQENSLFIRDLKSINHVPAIQNAHKDSYMVLVNAELGGGASTATAIENEGFLVMRDVEATGYGKTVLDHQQSIDGTVLDYATGGMVFGVEGKMTDPPGRLGLTVRETPTPPEGPLSDWVNVRDFGARAEVEMDNSQAIQKAVDSLSDKTHANFGKSTIYFPNDSKTGRGHHYFMAHPVRLHGNLRRVVGFGSALCVTGELRSRRSASFMIEDIISPTLWIEGFIPNWGPNWDLNYTHLVEHRSPVTLVLRDIGVTSYLYRASPGAGDVFIENVAIGQWGKMPEEPCAIFIPGQKVWARQFNPERAAPSAPPTKQKPRIPSSIMNEGATLWILGLKTEGGQSQLSNHGGQVEVLGSYIWAGGKNNSSLFNNRGGKLWVSMTQTYVRGETKFGPILREWPGNGSLSMKLLPQRTGWAAGTWAPVLRSGF